MGETNFFILVLESSSDFLYGIHFILAKTLRLWVTGRLNSSSEFGYWFDPWIGKFPWRRERLPTPVFLTGEFHGLYSPWGHKESDMTERLSLSLLSKQLQRGL